MGGSADNEAQALSKGAAADASAPSEHVPPSPALHAASKPSSIPAAFHRGPVAALENDLRQSMSQTLRDIDTSLIDPSPFSDRLADRKSVV